MKRQHDVDNNNSNKKNTESLYAAILNRWLNVLAKKKGKYTKKDRCKMHIAPGVQHIVHSTSCMAQSLWCRVHST